jgi:hypothetical protein
MLESENHRIYWPAVLAVFVVQMIVLVGVSFAVANHSGDTTASIPDFKANLTEHETTERQHGCLFLLGFFEQLFGKGGLHERPYRLP